MLSDLDEKLMSKEGVVGVKGYKERMLFLLNGFITKYRDTYIYTKEWNKKETK